MIQQRPLLPDRSICKSILRWDSFHAIAGWKICQPCRRPGSAWRFSGPHGYLSQLGGGSALSTLAAVRGWVTATADWCWPRSPVLRRQDR